MNAISVLSEAQMYIFCTALIVSTIAGFSRISRQQCRAAHQEACAWNLYYCRRYSRSKR